MLGEALTGYLQIGMLRHVEMTKTLLAQASAEERPLKSNSQTFHQCRTGCDINGHIQYAHQRWFPWSFV
jgi:hypothetical protein